jgi:uncharacterized protein (DUF1919 family)
MSTRHLKCHIARRLLKRFDACISSDLVFVNESYSLPINLWRDRKGLEYPIGLLEGDVELHFVHYADQADARSKWQRRCRRIVEDPSRCFFKFDDRHGATADDIEEFCASSIKNKVCFTVARHSSSTVLIPAAEGAAHVADGVALSKISRRYFNALRWISTWPAYLRSSKSRSSFFYSIA